MRQDFDPTADGSPLDAQQAEPTTVRSCWTMLLALISAFALSQAYRTLAAIMAAAAAAGLWVVGAVARIVRRHFPFRVRRPAAGDGHWHRSARATRTMLTAFPLAIVGAALAALAPNFGTLLARLRGLRGVHFATISSRALRGGVGALDDVCYASSVTLRGLWLGRLLKFQTECIITLIHRKGIAG